MFPWPGGAGTRRLGLPPPQAPLAISMGAPVVTHPHPCSALAQPFNPFFEQVGGHQHPPVGLPGLGKFAVIGVVISWSSLWDLLLVVGSPFLISFWYGSTLPLLEALIHRGQDVPS